MDKELRERIARALAKITPAGAKFSVDGCPVIWVIELSCDGEDKTFGYQCCLEPGHKGLCYSTNKKLYFERTNRPD